MKKIGITAIVIGLMAFLTVMGSLFLAGFVMTGERQTLEEARKWQSERYDTSFYDELEKEEFIVEAGDGYLLHAEFLKNPALSTKYIVISHGYTDNRMGALKYVPMYLELGYNCIIYDLRGHGENESTFTTYGIREGSDLATLIEVVRDRYKDMTKLGLHGESLGAASTVFSLKFSPKVDFVVADCGFSDIDNVLREGYRNAHVPTFLVDLADLGARIRYGYALKDMRPIDSLNENEVPILFLHGAEDNFILPQNSQDMYDRTQGYKEIHLIPGAGHAESVLTDPEAYHRIVKEYLAHIK